MCVEKRHGVFAFVFTNTRTHTHTQTHALPRRRECGRPALLPEKENKRNEKKCRVLLSPLSLLLASPHPSTFCPRPTSPAPSCRSPIRLFPVDTVSLLSFVLLLCSTSSSPSNVCFLLPPFFFSFSSTVVIPRLRALHPPHPTFFLCPVEPPRARVGVFVGVLSLCERVCACVPRVLLYACLASARLCSVAFIVFLAFRVSLAHPQRSSFIHLSRYTCAQDAD